MAELQLNAYRHGLSNKSNDIQTVDGGVKHHELIDEIAV